MRRFVFGREPLAATVWTIAALLAGAAAANGEVFRCTIWSGVYIAAALGLKVLTDRREQRAFDNGVRAASDAAREAIRETLYPTSDRRGGVR